MSYLTNNLSCHYCYIRRAVSQSVVTYIHINDVLHFVIDSVYTVRRVQWENRPTDCQYQSILLGTLKNPTLMID